jgi:O-antigen/teichoic acid export membrane protein
LYIVAQQATVHQAGYFGVGQALLVLPGVALAAVSVVLLPYATERLAAGDVAGVQVQATRLFHAIADISVYVCLHFALFADVILRLWLGDAMQGATEAVRILMIAVPFYSVYFSFRSIVDAASHRPTTTINLVVSFACFAAVYAVLQFLSFEPSRAAAFALCAAFMVLGGLTVAAVGRYIRIVDFFDTATIKILGLNLMLAAAAFFARNLAELPTGLVIIIELLCVHVFVTMLFWQKRGWCSELVVVLRGKRSLPNG